MNLMPLFEWDKTLENIANTLYDNILFVKSKDISIINHNITDNIYKGYNLDMLCRYEKLAELNLSMNDYKNAAISYIDYFENIFNNNKIDKVISWNNVLSFRKIPYLMAKERNIETEILDYSAFKNHLIRDKNDVSVYSDFYKEYINHYRFKQLNNQELDNVNTFIDNYKQNQITRIADDKCNDTININNYSLVILQVQNDANILYYQDKIINNSTILKYLKDNPHKKYLIRNHPLTENKSEIQKYFKDYRFADTYKLHNLLDNCNEVITINSSVGIEALCYDKKVICLGNAVYDKVIDNKNFLYYYINKFTIQI